MRWSLKQGLRAHTVHFASLMDRGHLKYSELEPQVQRCKGRIVLRDDIVKDDSGSYAVFSEQGSSASQMSAAKVMGIISRLTGCAGQAADAVSAYNPGQKGRCTTFIEDPQISRYVCQNARGLNHGPVWKIQSFFLSGIYTVILYQDYYGKGNSRKFFWKRMGKIPHWECLFVNREKGLFLSVYGGRNQNGRKETQYGPNVENSHERRWFGRANIIPWPCLFRLHSTRMQKKTKILWTITGLCLNPREHFHYSENSEANISSWSYDMEGHAKNAWKDVANWPNKTTQQLHTVATPWIDDHQFKEEEMGSVGELSKVCSQIVLN